MAWRAAWRGAGRSDFPGEEPLTLKRLTLDVIELMDHLGLASAHLAGSSAGGIISMFAAVAHPARVRSLSAFAAIPGLKMSAGHTDYGAWMAGIRDDGVRALLKGSIADRFNMDEVDRDFVVWFLDEAARNDPDLLIRFVGLMSGVDFADRLGEFDCPTLLVVPGGDPNQSMEEYRFCRDSIKGLTMVVYDGKRHHITDAVPRRYAADLLAFLREVRPERSVC